jgi:ribosomal protein L22
MADEKDTKKKAAVPQADQPDQGTEKPKRARSTGTRKAASEKKPARAKPRAKAKADDKEKSKEKAAPSTTRRRTTTRAKKQEEAPKAETKQAQPEAAEEKAPARRPRSAPKREASRPAPAPPVVTARARYVRSSPRKARLVIDHVRGKPIGEARALLRHSPRGVARDIERLLASAIANAENNHDLVGEDLYVKEIYADEGPTLKRFRARAQGRAYRIRKRTSHLTVALTPKE